MFRAQTPNKLIPHLGLWNLNVGDLHKDPHKHINSATIISKCGTFKIIWV